MPIKINNHIYPVLIFDVDDTLIDTSKSYDEAIRRTVKNYTNVSISNEYIDLVRSSGISYGVNNDWNVTWLLIQLVQHFPAEQWKIILTNQGLEHINSNSVEYIEIKDFFQNIYLGHPHFNGQGLIEVAEEKMYKNHFFPTLKKRGVKMAIVTSRPTNEALYTLKNINGLLNEFIESEHFIITTGSKNAKGELIAEKPSPQPILESVKRLKMKVKESVYIGNSTSDYIAARDAGVDFIQVGTSQIERHNEAKGFNYFKFDNVNDIL
jgi:histidinol-phosphate aminotransferase